MYPTIKRLLDFSVSLFSLIILSPVFLALIIGVMTESPGSAFFTQRRIGKDKKEFNIIKFRSMRTDTPRDVPTHLFTDPEKYITKTGRFLRRYSLDELPQLINILRGDMSIVGPRPALWNQFDLIAERDKYNVNSIRPGLTGLAQIMGRDELPIAVKADYDRKYYKSMSLITDMKIIFSTFFKVMAAEGQKEGADNENPNNG